MDPLEKVNVKEDTVHGTFDTRITKNSCKAT